MGCKIWINKNHIYLSLCYNGKRWRESTGLTVSSNKQQNKEVMRVAEIMRSNREIAIASGLANISPDCKLTLYDYCKKFVKSEKQQSAMNWLLKYGGDSVKVSSINSTWLENFTHRLENETELKKTSSKATYLSFIRQCLTQAYKENIINKNPCIGVKNIRIIKTEKPFLTITEIKQLKETPIESRVVQRGYEIKTGFLLACFTGLRYSDIRTLRVENIKNNMIVKTMEKTGLPVKVPLNGIAIEMIQRIQPDANGFLFPELYTKPKLSYSEQILKKWVSSAGIEKNVSWHIARHTHAVLLLESGADLYTVQKLLGHTQIQTTEVYADITDKKRHEAEKALADSFN